MAAKQDDAIDELGSVVGESVVLPLLSAWKHTLKAFHNLYMLNMYFFNLIITIKSILISSHLIDLRIALVNKTGVSIV